MDNQPPLDLRSLGEVDSPEVIRAALASFRRRVVVRSLWAMLALLVGAAAIYALAWSPNTVRDQIQGATIAAWPERGAWDVDGARVVLLEVADLGEGTVGLQFAVAPDQRGHPWYGDELHPAGTLQSVGYGLERYFEVKAPIDGRIEVRVLRHGTWGNGSADASFTIDLPALGVPSDIWR